MPRQLRHRRHVLDLLGICMERETLGHLPYEDLAIVRRGGDDAVVERVPVGVEDGSRVAAEERYLVGDLALLVERDDGEGASAAGLPIDRQVLGIGLDFEGTCQLRGCLHRLESRRAAHLYEIGIPCISADVEVIVAEFFPRRLAEDVSCVDVNHSVSDTLAQSWSSTFGIWGRLTILRRSHEAARHG
jgi:hypothetical protein